MPVMERMDEYVSDERYYQGALYGDAKALPIEVDGGGYLYTDGKTWSAASDDGEWLPGIYADETAARKALAMFDDHYDELIDLARWEVHGRGADYRLITVADLDAIARAD